MFIDAFGTMNLFSILTFATGVLDLAKFYFRRQ
jgi:hypothetical protein